MIASLPCRQSIDGYRKTSLRVDINRIDGNDRYDVGSDAFTDLLRKRANAEITGARPGKAPGQLITQGRIDRSHAVGIVRIIVTEAAAWNIEPHPLMR